MNSLVYPVYHWFAQKIPRVIWNRRNEVTEAQKEVLARLLADDYYVILTGDHGTLSSWIVSFFTWIETGKWSPYSHALMNCDFITDPSRRDEYKFVEATAKGVHYSTFDHVFSCDHVCLLSPKNMTKEDWTKVIDSLVQYDGRPYDDLFDLADASKVSCVELVLNAFKGNEKYNEFFPNLERELNKGYQLLPQMFIDCGDFEIEYEIENGPRNESS